MSKSSVFRGLIASRNLILLAAIVLAVFGLHSFVSLKDVSAAQPMTRERLERSLEPASPNETRAPTLHATGEDTAPAPRQMVIGGLLDLAERHGVRIRVDAVQVRSRSDAGIAMEVKLTGSYNSIRAWLVDAFKTSPELLVSGAQFRRGATDGDAVAEISFGGVRR
jgi:hypothetical protein